jgi:7,8-dihydroneopterin aldolase/epimerase/oxygenase
VHSARQDRITLSGIKLYPRIGTDPGEQDAPQECLADLSVWGDFSAAAATDSLDRSIDYVRILAIVRQAATSREYNLLETLAQGIARAVLQSFPLHRVRIKLRKKPASLADQIDFVEVQWEES